MVGWAGLGLAGLGRAGLGRVALATGLGGYGLGWAVMSSPLAPGGLWRWGSDVGLGLVKSGRFGPDLVAISLDKCNLCVNRVVCISAGISCASMHWCKESDHVR